MCAAKKFEGKKIIDLEKVLSKTQKDDLYFEKFRQSGKQVKASMKLVASFVLHQVGFVSQVYCKSFSEERSLPGGLQRSQFHFEVLDHSRWRKGKSSGMHFGPTR